MTLAGLVDRLRVDPARTVLLLGFDGTLSPTFVDPAAARPADGVVPVLTALAVEYRTVGVVSGRPLDVLDALLPAGVVLSGQYGLERRAADGTRSGSADDWRSVVLAAADDPERHYVEVILPQKVAMYLDYVRTRSFLGDLRVIVGTLAEIVRG